MGLVSASTAPDHWSDTASRRDHAVLWQNGQLTDLGTLPGGSLSFPYGINDSGQIVGWSDTASEFPHAVLWTPTASDTTPPVVTVTVPQPTHGLNGWFNAQDTLPVSATVSADDSTTGGNIMTRISCTVNDALATPSNVTGLSTVAAQGTLAVSAEGISTIRCMATDSAGNAGATGTSNTGVVKIDTQAPNVACPSPAPDFILNQPGATLKAAVTDPSPGAGPDPASGTAGARTAQVGRFTVSVTGQDLAGNATTVDCADRGPLQDRAPLQQDPEREARHHPAPAGRQQRQPVLREHPGHGGAHRRSPGPGGAGAAQPLHL